MFYLPNGVEINELIDDLRFYSWSSSDILINYSKKLEDYQFRYDFIKNKENNSPVTQADLDVNNFIIEKLRNKYTNIDWEILSEETVNIESKKRNGNV